MVTLFVLLTAATGEAPDLSGYYIFMGTFTLFVGIFTPLLVWAVRTIKNGSNLTASVKEGQAIITNILENHDESIRALEHGKVDMVNCNIRDEAMHRLIGSIDEKVTWMMQNWHK